MPVMLRNDLLQRAKDDPSVLTSDDVKALVAEVLRDRKFIQKTTTELPVAKNQTFFRELLAVSTGTFATLTGVRDYKALSLIETNFAIFYLFHQDAKYDSWMDVWKAFVDSPEGLTA